MLNKSNLNFERKIYFEKQSNDKLCGLHCLNSLLQGPFFDAIQLSEIAIELDKNEKLLLNKDELLSNENVDLDGNYNIQVLTKALSIYKANAVPIKAVNIIDIMTKCSGNNVEGLIFNSMTHWFSIRKIENIWYNLNSTNKFPEVISDFYLSAFILGTEEIGYSNFIVYNLPELPDEVYYSELQNNQLLFSVKEIHKLKNENTKVENNTTIKQSNKDKKEFKPFSGNNCVLEVNNSKTDDDLKQAIDMSLNIYLEENKRYLNKEPLDNDASAYDITFRYKDIKFSRKFNEYDSINQLKLFVQIKIKTLSQVELSESFPKKIYSDDSISLKQSGLTKRHLLNVKLL